MTSMLRSESQWTNLAVIGPAQHGKSTLSGFVLFAHNEVERRVMREAERAASLRGDPGLKYAFLLDRRPEERGISRRGRSMTRRTSWWGFESAGRRYLLMDSPGQLDRVHHMIGTVSEADASVLVVDTRDYLEALEQREERRENSGRIIPNSIAQIRAYLAVARFYRSDDLVIALHKMDRVAYRQESYDAARQHLEQMCTQLGFDRNRVQIVPTAVQATADRSEDDRGHNIVDRSPDFKSWYNGPTFVEAVSTLPRNRHLVDAALRMQVNSVYQGKGGVPGYEMVITGKILSGHVEVRDELAIAPSGAQCRVLTIESIDSASVVRRERRWNSIAEGRAGELIGLGCTISDHGSGDGIRLGSMAGRLTSPPHSGSRLRAELIVLHVPQLASLLSNRLAGTFHQGYFHTGCQFDRFSVDGGQDWVDVDPDGKTVHVEDIVRYEGDVVQVELTLARKAPLDVYVEGTVLGRFSLMDTNSFLVCGGRITAILD